MVQRAILDNPDLQKRLSFVFLFGTPSDGLEKATFGRRFLKLFKQKNRQIRDMAHNSEFIKDLRARRPAVFDKPSFIFRAAAGDKDEFVPARSSLEPFKKEFQRVVPGNHLKIIRPDKGDRDNESVRLVVKTMMGDAAYAGPWNSARVAVEKGDFQAAVEAYEPHIEDLDENRMVELALAYESLGDSQKSLQILARHAEKYGKKHLDVIGTMGGRLKRRWLRQGTLSDAERAMSLYNEGYVKAVEDEEHDMAHYLGINVAFMLVAMHRGNKKSREEAQQVARNVLKHCNEDEGRWKIASEAEALLHLDQIEQALLRYQDYAKENPTPRELESTFQQAELLINILIKPKSKREIITNKLESIFRPQV